MVESKDGHYEKIKQGGIAMNAKKIVKKTVSFVLAFILFLTGILSEPITARAAGWPDYAKDLTLGSAVTGSIKIGDYNGTIENITSISDSYKYYWNVYRFSMPKDGLLNIYIESGDSQQQFINIL